MKKIIILTLIVILTACSFGGPTEAEKYHQKWQDTGITSYRFSLLIGCFCPFRNQMPLTIEVKNGEVVSMTYPDGSDVQKTDPGYDMFSRYGTIERIFSELEAGQAGDAEEVTVTYDSALSFPNDIYFDFIKNATDDEIKLMISNLEAIP